jgi:adenylate cyclase
MRVSPRFLWSLRSLLVNSAYLTIGTTLLVVALASLGLTVLDMVELKTYDYRVLSRPPRQPSAAVALALIDEKSLDAEGRWPWPRSKLAALVDLLSKDGAKVIAFDIGFLDENPHRRFINQFAEEPFGHELDAVGLKHPRLADLLHESKKHADQDLALADAIRHSPAAVVLGYFFHMREADLNYRLERDEIARQLDRIRPSRYPVVMYKQSQADASPFLTAYAPESNLGVFTDAAESSGYFTLRPDPDGVARWMPLAIQSGDDVFPPLAVLAAWHYLDRPPLMVKVGRYGVEGVQMGDRVIPSDENGQLLINYLGPPNAFPAFSITDVLSGKTPRGSFKDRIVLVGATALGNYDLKSTPVSPAQPALELHATVIDNVLTRNFLTRPNWSKIYDLLVIVIIGALIGIVLPRLSALTGLVFAAGLLVLYVVTARWLFVHHGLWLNIVYPLLAVTANYTALTTYRYVTEERERRKVKEAFKQYVPPVVIDQMLRDPDRLKLGGEQKILTVLFSDLEGFAAYSERYAPDEMIGILSDYFEGMTEQIFAFHGTLKEYVADELMAIFGAPLEQPDHAIRACGAALAMREQREALRAQWSKTGRPPLNARTGINSGPMLVGNLGSKYRFAYGVLGDHVNLGSRLEALNKLYGTEILIGENTARLVERSFLLREVDMVRVVGKRQPVRIYELLAAAGTSLPPEREKALQAYADGLEAYRQLRWYEALRLFRESLALWREDGPSRTMTERCQIYQKSPPIEAWDGVFDQVHKIVDT